MNPDLQPQDQRRTPEPQSPESGCGRGGDGGAGREGSDERAIHEN